MRRLRLFTRSLITPLLVLGLLAYPGAAPAQAATVQITVSLYRVVELSCDEGVGESCGNDYYPKFKIDDQDLYDGKDDFCCAHGGDFRTNWVRQATVDTSHNPVAIHLELWDQDDGSGDDVIHWAKNGDYLDLTFDLNTCVFTGGGLTTEQGANFPTLAGESETGGEDSARGYFTITTPSCIALANTTDSDGDGIMNAWESPGQGLDVNSDGTIDLALGDGPYNALPYRKDLFVEVDYMTDDKPEPGALTDVINAFADAPVDPSGTEHLGINLHAVEDEAVPNVPDIEFNNPGPDTSDDFNDLKNGDPIVRAPSFCTGFFGTAADRSSANCVHILDAKRQVYRYMIFGDSYARGDGSSGSSEWTSAGPQGGNDFIVTLGSWDDTAIANVGGRRNAEAATFMHELGHTLSLGHGGDDFTNCKPNYLSVMNYTLQFTNRDSSRLLDYSSGLRGTALAPALNEAHLDENDGVRGTPDPARNTVYGVGGKLKVAAANDGPLDWNGTDGGNESDIAADVNHIESIGPKNEFGCSAGSAGQTLDGFDDWANIQYDPRLNAGFFADGVRPDLPPELTEQTVLAMSQKADLKITKTADQTEAVGGETVNYTVSVTDLGPGTATDISVTDTLPDGTTRQRSLPDLNNGGVTTIAPKFSYLVPCATTDGTVLTNSVTVTGKDTDGVPDPYVSDNTARATTTVRAPVLTVSATATATVNAGEAITHTITYANDGGSGASNVTVTDTLPAGVYYSPALDLGGGPKPGSVTLNGDGTRTLVWNVGDVPAHSGDRKIVFTARPTLLALAGTTYPNNVSVSYQSANGACTFTPVTASAATSITVVAPSRLPLLPTLWALRTDLRTAEVLARVQATDTRFDGADGSAANGALSQQEASAVLFLPVTQPRTLRAELLSTTFNLATRRINAGTAVSTFTTRALGLNTVGDAVRYAQTTLVQPPTLSNLIRYTNTTRVLTEINSGVAERY